MRSTGRRLGTVALVLIPGLLIWELLGRLEFTFIIPPFSDVFVAGLSVWSSEQFTQALGGSISSLLTGFFFAVVTGVTLGVLMGQFTLVEWLVDPYINVLMSAPKAALIPVIVLFFGFGRIAVILTVFMYAFFPIVVNTAAGIRQTPRNLIEMARSFGASEWRIARRVTIPAAAPLIFGGIRFGAARSIKGLVIGEQLITVIGIGSLIQRYGTTFQFDYLYAIILLIALAGLTVSGGLQWAEVRLMPWLPQSPGRSRRVASIAGGSTE